MPMAASEIERLIKESIPDAEVTIRDLAGDGDHYSARVVARSFEGMSRIRQHQAVYTALGGRVGGELHALQLETAAPQPETNNE
jgi:stress-induced morphogen